MSWTSKLFGGGLIAFLIYTIASGYASQWKQIFTQPQTASTVTPALAPMVP